MQRRRPMDFAQMVESAQSHWESVLGRIEIEGATDEQREVFYSALYHSTIKPADFTDENPFRPVDGPFFFDLSTLWDLYKTQLPLVMSLWPEMGKDFCAFLLEVAKREGAFPVSYLMDIAPERFAKAGDRPVPHDPHRCSYARDRSGLGRDPQYAVENKPQRNGPWR